MVRAGRDCYSMLKKFFVEVLPKKVHRFFISSSITSNCRITSFGFHPLRNLIMARCDRAKYNLLLYWDQCLGCLRMEVQGVLNHQAFLVKKLPFLLPPRKQDNRCVFKGVLN